MYPNFLGFVGSFLVIAMLFRLSSIRCEVDESLQAAWDQGDQGKLSTTLASLLGAEPSLSMKDGNMFVEVSEDDMQEMKAGLLKYFEVEPSVAVQPLAAPSLAPEMSVAQQQVPSIREAELLSESISALKKHAGNVGSGSDFFDALEEMESGRKEALVREILERENLQVAARQATQEARSQVLQAQSISALKQQLPLCADTDEFLLELDDVETGRKQRLIEKILQVEASTCVVQAAASSTKRGNDAVLEKGDSVTKTSAISLDEALLTKPMRCEIVANVVSRYLTVDKTKKGWSVFGFTLRGVKAQAPCVCFEDLAINVAEVLKPLPRPCTINLSPVKVVNKDSTLSVVPLPGCKITPMPADDSFCSQPVVLALADAPCQGDYTKHHFLLYVKDIEHAEGLSDASPSGRLRMYDEKHVVDCTLWNFEIPPDVVVGSKVLVHYASVNRERGLLDVDAKKGGSVVFQEPPEANHAAMASKAQFLEWSQYTRSSAAKKPRRG